MHRLCLKPRIKCSECPNRELLPLTDTIIAQHLDGKITIGVYPMLFKLLFTPERLRIIGSPHLIFRGVKTVWPAACVV